MTAARVGVDDELDPGLVAEFGAHMSGVAGFIGHSGFFGSRPKRKARTG